MLISLLSDIWLVNCATRWEIGAVEVTHGHEPVAAPGTPAAAVPAAWAAAAGTATSPDTATVTTAAVTSRRRRGFPQLRRMRGTIGHVISRRQVAPPPRTILYAVMW